MTILFKNGNKRRVYNKVDYLNVVYNEYEKMYALKINNESLEFKIHPDMIADFNDFMDEAIFLNMNVIIEYKYVKERIVNFLLITDFKYYE